MGKPEIDALLERLQLYSEEAETAVLGAMLSDPDRVLDLQEQLTADDFYKSSHRLIYEAIRELTLSGKPADAVTVKHSLETKGRLGEIGGPLTLTALMEATPVLANAPYYARIVKEKSVLRGLARTCAGILADLQYPSGEVEQILDRAQAQIFQVSMNQKLLEIPKMDRLIEETFRDVMTHFKNIRDRSQRLLGLPTGLYDLDDLLCGLQKGYLYVVAGRPSMGKSSFCLRLLEEVTVHADPPHPALMFSVEMSRHQVTTNMLCSFGRVNSFDVRRGSLGDAEVQKLMLGAGRLSEAPLWIDDSADLSILELRARARRAKARDKIELVVVDYLQKVTARAETRQAEISLITSQLKAMAKELDVPVVAVAQLNRAPESREDKRPMLSDLRESGAIEQDADVVMLLFREGYYKKEFKSNRCQVDVAKNRTGPTAVVEVVFQPEWTRFESAARGAPIPV